MGATDSEALMKAGLILVLLGHGILLLGALVHGIVLRQVGLSEQAPAVESTAANIAALLAGLVGTIIGISIIILAKNRDSRTLMWLLLAGSVPGALLAAGSALCLTVTLVKVVVGGRRSLLLQCQLPDMANYSDVHNDYPFSSNHIYGGGVPQSHTQDLSSLRFFCHCCPVGYNSGPLGPPPGAVCGGISVFREVLSGLHLPPAPPMSILGLEKNFHQKAKNHELQSEVPGSAVQRSSGVARLSLALGN